MKKSDFMLALSAACLCFSSLADAANFYWVGVSNDWRNAASYSSVAGGPGGTQMPGAEDRVVLSANQKVYVDDSAAAPGEELGVNAVSLNPFYNGD